MTNSVAQFKVRRWHTAERLARQHVLEEQMADAGRASAAKHIRECLETGHAERTAGGDAVIRKWLVAATHVIEQWRNRETTADAALTAEVGCTLTRFRKKPGRSPDHLKLVDRLTSSQIAVRTLSAIAATAGELNDDGTGMRQHDGLERLARSLEDAAYTAWIVQTGNADLIHDNEKRAVRGGWSAAGRRLNLQRSVAAYVGDWQAWERKSKMALALSLFDLADKQLRLVKGEPYYSAREKKART